MISILEPVSSPSCRDGYLITSRLRAARLQRSRLSPNTWLCSRNGSPVLEIALKERLFECVVANVVAIRFFEYLCNNLVSTYVPIGGALRLTSQALRQPRNATRRSTQTSDEHWELQ